MAIRLNQLAAGGGGARPEVLDGLAALLASGAVPPVREHGGVGTGDLGPLATIALALPGVEWTADDALPFLSSNAATLADAALAAADLLDLARAGIAVAAMTFVAVDGAPEAFSPTVEALTPYDGVASVCAAMRALTAAGGAAGGPAAGPVRAALPAAGARAGAGRPGPGRPTWSRTAPCAWAENPAVDLAAGHARRTTAASTRRTSRRRWTPPGSRSPARPGWPCAGSPLLLDPTLTGLAAFLGDGTPGRPARWAWSTPRPRRSATCARSAAPASLQTVVALPRRRGRRQLRLAGRPPGAGRRRAVRRRAGGRAGRRRARGPAARARAARRRAGATWCAPAPACRAPAPGELADRDLTPDMRRRPPCCRPGPSSSAPAAESGRSGCSVVEGSRGRSSSA